MSVHNFDNGNDYVEDLVTLISKLDISNPLHLHDNDSTALTVVSTKLNGNKNYQVWSCAMLLALEGKNKSGFIDGSCKRNNFQRNNQNVNSGPRPNSLNNNRQCGGSTLVCENCGFNVHTIDRCFKIIGYLADFGKKKPGQSFKGQNVSNNNFVGSSSSSGFTNEQMATLISLIKDNKVRKNVQANMAENKIIVAFDDSRCCFLNQDLNMRNVLGTGNQCEGLYYYNNQGPNSLLRTSGCHVDWHASGGCPMTACHVAATLTANDWLEGMRWLWRLTIGVAANQ
ncbi:ribonuclease H-like domain-containing protein [Tanacetum coccineum]